MLFKMSIILTRQCLRPLSRNIFTNNQKHYDLYEVKYYILFYSNCVSNVVISNTKCSSVPHEAYKCVMY